MCKVLAFVSAALFISFSVMVMQAGAHGGFQKTVGGTTIYITQSPISPLVGENVKLTLVFQKTGELERFANMPIRVNIIDTYTGDESRDKVIYTKKLTTDANGALSFDYRFLWEDFFDIEIEFDDATTKKQTETGFLIQTRHGYNSPVKLLYFLAGIMVCGTVAVVWSQHRKTSVL